MLKLEIKKPRQFINPLLSKKSIKTIEFELFKSELSKLKCVNQSESEEHQKNIVKDFLVNTFKHKVNTKGRIDLAIFKDNNVEVIIEAKRLDNTAEMITKDGLHKKAFAEAVKYFMDERQAGNFSVKHIIILTAFEWFIFDAQEFEKLFWKDPQFKKVYTDYTSSSSLLSKTGDVYNEFINLFKTLNSRVSLVDDPVIKCAYFNLKELHSDRQFIAIYKLLSPDTLLKEFNPNDANTLNKEFYSELLYILGLEELKSGGKKLIARAKKPHSASLYENIARNLKLAEHTQEFETIIRLMIIWINRILFLKLLESQLIRWNEDKDKYSFLNAQTIHDFDRLKIFFFDILANKPHDRDHKEFSHIPYLNSSLFEMNEIEKKYIDISSLEDNCELPYYKKTVLKDAHAKRKDGEVNMLHYLFEFLDAYDFSSEGSEELVSESKSLINASVLGLIFEKLNGYKDGSFYTPSFITMYMSKETITKSIVEKFNQSKGWNCSTLDELDDKIEDKKEANVIIDSLTICDPAVGSGHFLVSSLNAILEIKSQLRILFDSDGKRIKDYELSVENDELIVRDDEGEIFEYKRNSKEKTRIQKMLFLEKQNIIENSLFGVDINPNSAQITRLRLWIELLKNSYYAEDSNLVTMPNIDINIKVGNSLISRYGLDDEIDIPNIKHAIERYKASVKEYKEGNFLSSKDDIRSAIDDVKDMFGLTLKAQWTQTEEYKKVLGKYVKIYGMKRLKRDMQLDALDYNFGFHGNLFDDELTAAKKKEEVKLLDKVMKCASDIEEIEKGKIYEDAFEWRFEFPEVLDEEGNFVGFDVVIGNPPWGANLNRVEKSFLKEKYNLIDSSTPNTFAYFIGLSYMLSKFSITQVLPDSILVKDFNKVRSLVKENIFNISWYQNAGLRENMRPFIDVEHDVCIFFIHKDKIYMDTIINKREVKEHNLSNISIQMRKEDFIFEEYSNIFNLSLSRVKSNFVHKLKKKKTISEIIQCHEGIHSGNIREKLFKKENLIGNERKMFLGARSGDIIDNYKSNVSTWFVDYRKEIIHKDKGEYASLRNINIFIKPKIYITRTGNPLKAFLDIDNFASNNFFSLQFKDYNLNTLNNLKNILAFINSKFANFYIRNIIAPSLGDIFIETKIIHIMRLPFIDSLLSSFKIKESINQIISLKDKNQDTMDLEAEIDQMVYELYGLSDDEVALVEGKEA